MVRTYRSELRDAQAAATGERIVDAALELMVEGGDPTMAQVAERAGVAVRTLYRHFPDRDALGAAIGRRFDSRVRTDGSSPPPADLDELLERLHHAGRAIFAHEAEHRASLVSPAALESRKATAARRLAWLRHPISDLLDELDDADGARLVALLRVLNSAGSLFTMVDYAELDEDDAVEAAAWAVRTLVEAARRDATARTARPARHDTGGT